MSDPNMSHRDALVAEVVGAGESRRLEFKRVGKIGSALQTIVAFANTDGGTLILGVEDENKASRTKRGWYDRECSSDPVQ